MSMDIFRYCSSRSVLHGVTSPILSPVVGTYVYCLWTFPGIVQSPLLYTSLDQSNLVGIYVCCLWTFSDIVRHGPLLYSVTSPISPPPVVGTYVYCLWTFSGIVRTPFINIQRYADPFLIFIDMQIRSRPD